MQMEIQKDQDLEKHLEDPQMNCSLYPRARHQLGQLHSKVEWDGPSTTFVTGRAAVGLALTPAFLTISVPLGTRPGGQG